MKHRAPKMPLACVLAFFLAASCSDDPSPVPHNEEDASDKMDAREDVPDPSPEPDVPEPVPGEAPIFRDGCLDPGTARARVWDVEGPAFRGHDARNIEGGWVLHNERAAFAISPIDDLETYWYYGGILVDAVALDGCRQAGEERFEELVVLLGHLNAGSPSDSTLRGFRGERGELISDGAEGGPAVVRVHGVDDRFWLVEMELVRQAFLAGRPRELSDPMGIEVFIDYILEPGASVLRAEIHVKNTTEAPVPVLTGTSLWFADTTEAFYGKSGGLSLAGFGLDAGLPWMAAHAADSSLAISLPDAAMAALSVSGVRSMVDATRVVGARPLAPAGEDGDERVDTILVAVGAGGANSATRHLEPLDPMLSGQSPILVKVTDPDGEAIEGATVHIERGVGQEGWDRFDRALTEADGSVEVALVHVPATGGRYRLAVELSGHPAPAPVAFTLPPPEEVAFEVSPGGTLTWAIADEGGRPMPAHIALWDEQGRQRDFDTGAEAGRGPLVPGAYAWQVWRGFEYAMVVGELEVPVGGSAHIEATLPRLVDTTGYLSTDTHLHASPSPDSDLSIPDRLRSAAAAGLEIPVSTDHEFVADWGAQLDAAGLRGWVRPVMGQEVTAPLPEHTNMYPVPRDDTHPRGGPVPWYALDPGELYAAIRARGAGVVQLNHPKQGCNYMCLIDWLTSEADHGLRDPTQLGFGPDQTLWSWDFDAVELFNGHTPAFLNPNRPGDTGLFDDWFNWHLAGHRITAMAVTDAHGAGPPGSPRTYLAASTDDPESFEDDMMIEAILGGRAIVSAGAFAHVQIEGAGPGQTASAEGQSVQVSVRIEAIPQVHVGWIKVYVNCREVASMRATDPGAVVKLDAVLEVPVTEDAAIVVAAFSDAPMPRGWKGYEGTQVPRVMTNPIFVDTEGNGAYDAPGPRACSYTTEAP